MTCPRPLAALLAFAFFGGADVAYAATCDKPALTRTELTTIALREAKAHGLKVDQGYSEVAISEDKCEYYVLVTLKPTMLGNHFSVRVARDRHVVYFMPGE